jgi:hypothetical protein
VWGKFISFLLFEETCVREDWSSGSSRKLEQLRADFLASFFFLASFLESPPELVRSLFFYLSNFK